MGSSDQSDEELLEAWAAGDDRAGAAIVSRHYESIYRFFVHRLGPGSEDLVQETFLGLQRSLHTFRRDCSVRIYLFKIARNQILNAIRNRVRDRARFDPSETTMAAIDPSPSEFLVKHDDQKLLVAALRRLSIELQIMFELHYWEHLTYREIAEIVEIPEGTARAKMSRGRRKLHKEMERLAESKEHLRSTLHRISGWIADLRDELGGGEED